MYLVNRPAELAQLLRSMRYVAPASGEQGDASLEAREDLERIAGELDRLPEAGGADRMKAILSELSARLIVTEGGMGEASVDSATWGSAGTLSE
jgi:hypothetical protein